MVCRFWEKCQNRLEMVALLETIWAPKSPKGGRKCHHAWDMCFAIPLGSLSRFPQGGSPPPYQQFLEALWGG